MASRDSREDYDNLCEVIQRWNERRVELFRISMPNEVDALFQFGLACLCSMTSRIRSEQKTGRVEVYVAQLEIDNSCVFAGFGMSEYLFVVSVPPSLPLSYSLSLSLSCFHS